MEQEAVHSCKAVQLLHSGKAIMCMLCPQSPPLYSASEHEDQPHSLQNWWHCVTSANRLVQRITVGVLGSHSGIIFVIILVCIG